MLPDPSKWTAEAFSQFRKEGLPSADWPQYRNRYIVQMTQVLAEERSKQLSAKLALNASYGSILSR